MNSLEHAELLEAIRKLHREKDAAYQDAWKRRDEVISILANLARKVDRLEHVLGGGPTGSGEPAVDTAADLLVYCLKYEAFLADLHTGVAQRLFGTNGEVGQPYSDGVGGFEYLLGGLRLSDFEATAILDRAAGELATRFNALETCFKGVDTAQPALARLERAQQLAGATTHLLGVLKEEYPAPDRNLLSSYLKRDS